jgi:two-component system NarL family response regulator
MGIRVLLADDHPLFLEGLRNLLAARGVQVVGSASDGLQALSMARSLRPDVILMDVRMPRCDGLTATRLVKAELPEIRVVMLTTSEEDDDLFEAVKSGASGYLLKSLDANQFFEYLSDLSRGDTPLSPGLGARILEEFRRSSRARPPAKATGAQAQEELTERQMEVLDLVARGNTYKEIAAALCLSERTVKYHMAEILKRLHLQNRTQAVAYAASTGLAPGGDKSRE